MWNDVETGKWSDRKKGLMSFVEAPGWTSNHKNKNEQDGTWP